MEKSEELVFKFLIDLVFVNRKLSCLNQTADLLAVPSCLPVRIHFVSIQYMSTTYFATPSTHAYTPLNCPEMFCLCCMCGHKMQQTDFIFQTLFSNPSLADRKAPDRLFVPYRKSVSFQNRDFTLESFTETPENLRRTCVKVACQVYVRAKSAVVRVCISTCSTHGN